MKIQLFVTLTPKNQVKYQIVNNNCNCYSFHTQTEIKWLLHFLNFTTKQKKKITNLDTYCSLLTAEDLEASSINVKKVFPAWNTANGDTYVNNLKTNDKVLIIKPKRTQDCSIIKVWTSFDVDRICKWK